MPDKKLFLLDALALIYRSHFAFIRSPRITSTGMNTSAVFGFTNTLLEVLEKEKPTHIGVAFDTAAPTFRHQQFAAYKAHRQAQPEDITLAIPYTRKLLEALHIPILILPGFEADDIIGTLAKKAVLQGFEVFMMTPDKDFGQLVEEHIHLYKPAVGGKNAEIWGIQEVLDRWGIKNVSQVVDMLGLQGDASDNIPGIPGIGEKTAQKLIQEYESVENLIANAEKLSGKIKENVIKFAEQGLLSKQLATIDVNVPLEFHEEGLLCSEPDKEAVAALCDELEFRTIKRRLLGEEMPVSRNVFPKNNPAKTASAKTNASGQIDLFAPANEEMDEDKKAIIQQQIQDINELFGDVGEVAALPEMEVFARRETLASTRHRYHLMDTPELRKSLIEHLRLQDSFCFDTETDGLDPVEANLLGFSFCAYQHEAYYVPVPKDFAEAGRIALEFKNLLENPLPEKVGQNLKFDCLLLKKYGIEVSGKLFDTMLADYLIAPDARHNMNEMAEKYLNYTPVPIEDLIGKRGKNQRTMADVDVEKVKEYAAEDADITLQLKEKLLPLLKKTHSEKLFYEVEMPLMPVLTDIEAAGVKIDPIALRESSAILETDIRQLEEKVFQLAGETFNLGSPKQLGLILFDKLKLDAKAKKTASGQYATGEEVLTRLADKHEIVNNILEHRQLQKLKSTYIDALPELISPTDGRIHTSFNQAVTATGRLSSTNPNLQNIPIRTDRGKEIRKAFVPRDKDHLILSADYSQIELRLMAHFSQDKTMQEAFSNGLDIHASTASKVFKVDLNAVTGDLRRKAKTVNFGIIYGISAFGLSERLGIPRSEGAEIIKAYFEEFPQVKAYMDAAIEKVRQTGYAETVLGRKRFLPDIHSNNANMRGFAERNAINMPLQGTAAEIIKLAMIKIHNWMRQEKLESKMILQVHDELVFDAHRSEIEILRQHIPEIMKNALPLSVPMQAEVGVGENWLEAH
jgi:DNA polymerase I